MHLKLIEYLNESMDFFLERWPELMDECGYLAETTAKREDCMLSYTGFLHPIFAYLGSDWDKKFCSLLNNPRLSSFIVAEGQKHRARGVTAEMFFGCFKTLIHTIEEIILKSERFTDAQKLDAVLTIRQFADASETLMIQDWVSRERNEVIEDYAKTNRQLTLDKNKYENIFDATTDLVIIVDEEGQPVEMNYTAGNFFEKKEDSHFWDFFDLKHHNLEDFFNDYPIGKTHEISFPEDDTHFAFRIIPLKKISLASIGYMVIMNDITGIAYQRSSLEKMVNQRTRALEEEKIKAEEMNITLKNVLGNIDMEKNNLEKNIYDNIKNIVLPTLEKLRKERDSNLRQSYAQMVSDQLMSITEKVNPDAEAKMVKLSRTELQICNYIKAGLSGKDICDLMNISFETIQTHRKNIRRKLGLKGEKINLYTYLAGK